jgi:prepilin-type N-terminal cleavage/methylation domain-containing protein
MQAHLKEQGFTLVELMVTVVIMGLFAAMAMPAMTKMGKGASQNEAAAGFASVINSARQEALRQGTPVYMCPANISTAGKLVGCGQDGFARGIVSYADSDKSNGYTAGESLRLYQVKSTLTVQIDVLNGNQLEAGPAEFGFQGNGNVIGSAQAMRFIFTDKDDPLTTARIMYVDYSGRAVLCKNGRGVEPKGYVATLCTSPDKLRAAKS